MAESTTSNSIEVFLPDLQATDKESAIRALLDAIYLDREQNIFRVNKEEVYKKIIDREMIARSTAIGGGRAFPHVRIEGWGAFTMAVGLSAKGVDFNSPDKAPSKVICLLISDAKEPYIILQVMSALVRFLNEKGRMEMLFEKKFTSGELAKHFRQCLLNAYGHILAIDLAGPVVASVTLETPIEKATQIMHYHHVDVLPVVDENNIFLGEVSCMEIFQYGMPDFFKQLNTISFIRHFDPFEGYFQIRKNLKVSDLYNKDVQPFKKNKTLVEVIFEMTVKQRTKIFVVDEHGSLSGVIDRFTIIDKILFF